MTQLRHYTLLSIGLLAASLPLLNAGDGSLMEAPTQSPRILDDPFERAIRPITNPTLFDIPIPRTQARPIFMHQNLPNRLNTTLGSLEVGGDFQLYALQFEYALSDSFSLVAMKDGYIDFHPDNLLSENTGFANLAAGFKWAFLLDPADKFAMSLTTQVEVPTGNSDVWQGTGDGAIIPAISMLKLFDRFQFAGALGAHFPFDQDEESMTMFFSSHVSYALTDRIFPLVEMNYFRVLDEGNGGRRFNDQVGGAVPSVANFEGGDLINLGAANASANRDLLTVGMGLRYRLSDNIDLGAAYEVPVTGKSENLMGSRLTFDLVYRF